MSSLYDLEEKVKTDLAELKHEFANVDSKKRAPKQDWLEMTSDKLNACKTNIKTWEREARTDGVNPVELKARKGEYVDELNTLLALKKSIVQDLQRKNELLAGAVDTSSPELHAQQVEGMNNHELMEYGRGKMKATNESIERSKKVVNETIQVGSETAVRLKGQTEQMEKVVQDLDHIHVDLRKAGRLVRDITRQMATDRMIMFFLGLVALGVLAIIVAKAVNPKTEGIVLPGDEEPSSPEAPSTRRLLQNLV